MKKYVLFILLILQFFIVSAGNYIKLDKEIFNPNDAIKISIDDPANYSLSIKSPSNVYRFLGIASDSIIFRAQQEGIHTIELYDSETQNAIDTSQFIVTEDDNDAVLNMNNNFVYIFKADKASYMLNDNVMLEFPDIAGASIKMAGPGKDYTYQDPKAPLFFRPERAGRYQLFLIVNETIVAKTEFIVNSGKKLQILDSVGKQVTSKIDFYKEGRLISGKKNDDSPDDIENDMYDVVVKPEIRNVEKIRFKNLNFEKGIDLGIEDINNDRFLKAYAVDPTRLDFTEAALTSVAIGTQLFKCQEWDFPAQKCLGTWKKIMDIVPGQEYSLTLTNKDPAYGESGTVPQPHPVKGFVYYSDNITRAENGIPVRIINNANGVSVLTQVYAPPLPLYKGSYSADILGNDGDFITILAWNSTDYGETNATLLSSVTNANVSIRFPRGSEPNVTILFPLNNTAFNISTLFNVTALITILNKNGINCIASLSFSNNIAQILPGESYQVSLGNLAVDTPYIIKWNFTAVSGGVTNISVNASCDSDKINIEGKKTDTRTNITFIDQIKPEITLFSPQNNTEVTNPLSIIFNASDATGLENCSIFINSVLNATLTNLQMFSWHTFNFTLSANTYEWKIGCYDNSTYHNYNETETRIFILPSWNFYYGNLSSHLKLADSSNDLTYTWEAKDTANIYVIETGSTINWLNLQALGRTSANTTATSDFYEADVNLSMTTYTDSVNNTFTANSIPKKTVALYIYNRRIRNIPIANSTNSSNFFTGILWDMSNGGSEYNGSQELVFVTNKSISNQGKYGFYDYEMRVPATLKNYKHGSNSVSFYIELT